MARVRYPQYHYHPIHLYLIFENSLLENNNAHHLKSLFICISKKNNQNDNIEARLFEKTLSGRWFQIYGKI